MVSTILDILISVVLVIASWRLAYLGLDVTLHPPSERSKKRVKWEFWVWGIVAVILAIAQGARTQISQHHLDETLGKLGAGVQHIQDNPPKVEVKIPPVVQPPKHTNVNFMNPFDDPVRPLFPIHQGEKCAVNIGYKNSGKFKVRASREGGSVLVVTTKLSNAFRDYRDTLKLLGSGGDLNPSNDQYLYATYLSDPLTDEQLSQLNSGKAALCAIGIVDWKDDSGHYETHFAQCLYYQGDGSFNWHMTPDNNVERKLE
jgi:hypothetical protein